jgi:hypothetical protein
MLFLLYIKVFNISIKNVENVVNNINIVKYSFKRKKKLLNENNNKNEISIKMRNMNFIFKGMFIVNNIINDN